MEEHFTDREIDAPIIGGQENCEPNPTSNEVSPPVKYERSPCTSPMRRCSLVSPVKSLKRKFTKDRKSESLFKKF